MTTDEGLHAQISQLVDREDEQEQLRQLEIQLDQCWDLLRQREALRNSGGDPASASIRPAGEVEGYLG